MNHEKRTLGFYLLAAFFALFVLFLYGPLSAILILSFQGPDGGLTFPLSGVSLHWFGNLFEQQAVGDFGASFRRSFALGLMVMAVTVVVSLLAGLAFRRKFVGATPVFYLAVASLVVPSIIVAALFAFLLSFDEVVISYFISSVQSETLPVKMYSSIHWEISPVLAAISSLLTVLSFGACVAMSLLQRNDG